MEKGHSSEGVSWSYGALEWPQAQGTAQCLEVTFAGADLAPPGPAGKEGRPPPTGDVMKARLEDLEEFATRPSKIQKERVKPIEKFDEMQKCTYEELELSEL